MTELSIPVTTDPDRIAQALTNPTRDGATTVVFSTYQSLDRVATAQQQSGAVFDLVVCDEAHRTTGVETATKGVSPFTLVHDNQKIRAPRRLYMTATPRLYTAQAKRKARSKGIAVFSMDDPNVFGDVFYEMSFKAAVDGGGWLSDYQVAIVAVDRGLYGDLADNVVNTIQLDHGDEIRADDVVAMLGCWDAMADPLSRGPGHGRRTGQTNPNPGRAVKRAIAFQNIIKASRQLARLWEPVIDGYTEQRPADADNGLLGLDVTHVDGTTRASERATAIADLKSDIPGGRCRVVSNARCLSEGVGVRRRGRQVRASRLIVQPVTAEPMFRCDGFRSRDDRLVKGGDGVNVGGDAKKSLLGDVSSLSNCSSSSGRRTLTRVR